MSILHLLKIHMCTIYTLFNCFFILHVTRCYYYCILTRALFHVTYSTLPSIKNSKQCGKNKDSIVDLFYLHARFIYTDRSVVSSFDLFYVNCKPFSFNQSVMGAYENWLFFFRLKDDTIFVIYPCFDDVWKIAV